jgi:hypothetical protein
MMINWLFDTSLDTQFFVDIAIDNLCGPKKTSRK